MNTKIFSFLLAIIFLQSCESIEDKIHLCDETGTSYYETDHFFSPTKINTYTDYEKGLACAKENNYLIFLHFSGYGCVGYPVFRYDIIHDRRVEKLLRENFLLLSIYVDDPKRLPQEEEKWVEINGKEKYLKTYGHKNSHLEISLFKSNSQPLFVILNSNCEQISEPWGYTKDPNIFIKKMESALTKTNQ